MFSNFYRHKTPLVIRGKEYATSEHFYQAAKYFPSEEYGIEGDPEYAEKIRLASTPGEAKKLGRKGKVDVDKWDKTKDYWMIIVLFEKFHQDSKCRDMLLSTGDARLHEDSPYDAYWGCMPDDSGKDRLGEMLVDVRDTLKAKAAPAQGEREKKRKHKKPCCGAIEMAVSMALGRPTKRSKTSSATTVAPTPPPTPTGAATATTTTPPLVEFVYQVTFGIAVPETEIRPLIKSIVDKVDAIVTDPVFEGKLEMNVDEKFTQGGGQPDAPDPFEFNE
jgi:ribA/ribD-fused uncharacterized protein